MSVSQELIATQKSTDRDKMIRTSSLENQIYTLITQQRYNLLCNLGLFNYSMFSAPGAIIGNFAK